MAVSEEDLEQKRKDIQDLREQIAAEDVKRVERETAQYNEIVAAQLDAEKARLTAELNRVKTAASAASVKEAASGPLDQAREELKEAQAVVSAQDKEASTASKSDEE